MRKSTFVLLSLLAFNAYSILIAPVNPFLACFIILVFVVVFFRAQPPTPTDIE